MPIQNDFLTFAAASDANVLTQAEYAAASATDTGYTQGVASSAAVNKTLRQATLMAAVIAQFIVDNTGEDAIDDGTTATLLDNLKKATTGRLIGVQKFAASGTYTPTPGTKSVIVELSGAGGAGGGTAACSASQASAGAGGGAGGYAKSRLTTGFSGVTITVGAGGTGTTGGAGGNGGASSFGALLSAPGGSGSGATAAQISFPFITGYANGGGVGIGGNILNASGGFGATAFMTTGGNVISGSGGASFFGAGANASINATANGNAATTPGSGGSGATTVAGGAARAGGNGAPGICIVYEYA
ncbi:hypothetical protein UU9_12238 [Rhodanobacter fulvus Jip2]|uniref:Glycine-rich domain-containing protein n=1 Tax=Rhodanobacter fulvus Jip2 TaxID=1163408 RepID=I4VMS6_9GAMM|nr:hypothetical protein [Rhodanobacter fulvus]EIL88517.1 hypothetical protein UU9_12238 [Rhodanobacter fulvus Jip2]